MVQGDTTSAMITALEAYYHKIPVAHVEAGLRTDDIYNPFPEEVNRRIITQIAKYNFTRLFVLTFMGKIAKYGAIGIIFFILST